MCQLYVNFIIKIWKYQSHSRQIFHLEVLMCAVMLKFCWHLLLKSCSLLHSVQEATKLTASRQILSPSWKMLACVSAGRKLRLGMREINVFTPKVMCSLQRLSYTACLWMSGCMRVCVCVCVCWHSRLMRAWWETHLIRNQPTYYLWRAIHSVCVCVCWCVWVLLLCRFHQLTSVSSLLVWMENLSLCFFHLH